MQTHLFRYNHDGKVWRLAIEAYDERDAKERLARLTFASYDGERIAKVPMSLGPLALAIVWFRNAAVALMTRFGGGRH